MNKSKEYRLSEMEYHHTAKDCGVALNGIVYNLTK